MDSSYWIAFPSGILIATVSSIAGIGGGIIWMPLLLLIFKLNPETAVLTSLLIQSFGMGSGTLAYLRRRQVDTRLARLILLTTIPGILAGSFLTPIFSPAQIEMVLGLMTLITAFLFVSLNQRYDDTGLKCIENERIRPYLPLISLMSMISGMLSLSIGEWLIPLMQGKMNLRMSTAIATSITTIFGISLLGALFHLGLGGRPEWRVLAWAAPGVFLGGQLGPRISDLINERILKELFIFLLTLVGIHLIYNAF
jgi:uncharacterized membrane protein YfcA